MGYYIEVLKNYAVFSGRARRAEYWMFALVSTIISTVLNAVVGALGALEWIPAIYSLAVLIPSIAVGVRRMHDTDHSGWWILVPIVSFIFAVTDGTPGNNRFGPSPKFASSDYYQNDWDVDANNTTSTTTRDPNNPYAAPRQI